jgi:hypothetical protein
VAGVKRHNFAAMGSWRSPVEMSSRAILQASEQIADTRFALADNQFELQPIDFREGLEDVGRLTSETFSSKRGLSAFHSCESKRIFDSTLLAWAA